jgi:hypothetical protein
MFSDQRCVLRRPVFIPDVPERSGEPSVHNEGHLPSGELVVFVPSLSW